MLARLAHFTTRRRWYVIAVWIALTLFGGYAAGQVSKRWYQSFSIPGKSAYEANQRTLETFGVGVRPPNVVVFHSSGDATKSAAIKAAMARAAAATPHSLTSSYFSTGNLMYVSKDRHTTFQMIYPPGAAQFSTTSGAPAERKAAASGLPAGITVHVTGHDPLEEASSNGASGGPSVLVEAVIGGLGALVILLFVFGTLPAVLMPIVVAGASILNTFTLVWALTYITNVSIIVQFLIALVGLGVAIDYALLMIFRFRDELREGADVESAIVETMTHAGRSVIVSGTTVAVGLLSLIVLPLPFIRSMGIGGMLIPAVSVTAAITLLPAMLSVLGTRINSVRVMPKRLVSPDHPEHGGWGRWARFVLRRPLPVAIVGLVIVGVLVTFGLRLNPNEAQLAHFPGTGDAIQGRDALLAAGISPGVMKPFNILVENGGNPQAIAAKVRTVDGVVGAEAPSTWRRGPDSLVEAFPAVDGAAPGIQSIVNRVNDSLDGTDGTLGGVAAVDRDFVHAIYGNFPYVLAFVMILTLILLARAFRSIVLPIKAVDPQPALARGGLRDHRDHLPGGPRLVALEHPGDRRDHGVDPVDDLRVPVRPLDGLRGLHAHADARGVRRDGLDEQGDRARPRPDRQARDERRADPDVRVPRALLEPGLRGQGVRGRARGGDHLRRDRDPRSARALADGAARKSELVDAELDAVRAASSASPNRTPEPAAEGA